MKSARILACLLLLGGCESPAEAGERLSLEGRALLEAHDFQSARERFSQASIANPTELRAWSGLAESEAALFHWPEARAAADHCIALTDDPNCRVVHAEAALHAEDWAMALDDQSRALALDPARTELYLARARASAHLTDTERTDRFYREAIDHEVEPAVSRLELALILLDRCGGVEGMDQERAIATSADRTKIRDLLDEARPLAEGETLAQIEAAAARSTALDGAARAAIPNPDPDLGMAMRGASGGVADSDLLRLLLGDTSSDPFLLGDGISSDTGIGDLLGGDTAISVSPIPRARDIPPTPNLGSIALGHGAGPGTGSGGGGYGGDGSGLGGLHRPTPPPSPNEN